MNAKELAKALNGREYGNEITEVEEKLAKENNLLVVYGYSDDNLELRGVIDDEIGAGGGISFYIRDKKLINSEEIAENISDLDYFKEYIENLVKKDLEGAKFIKAKYDEQGYSWVIETEAGHGAFDIYEDGEKFCKGIVVNIKDL